MIEISRNGQIKDDEISDFAIIRKKLDQVSLATDALNLWIDKTIGENKLNGELLETEMKKLSNK